MKHLFSSFILLFLSFSCTIAKPVEKLPDYAINYEVSMPEPSSHYFEVKMKVNDPLVLQKESVDFKMAVWTPGSYLIREYPKNVESVTANSNGTPLKIYKTSKNTWRVEGHQGGPIEVNYRLYAFEVSVRTNFLDYSHGYINGAPTFFFVPELMDKKASVRIIPHESFNKVSVALPEIAKNVFEVENFDLLVDSPFEIGNHEELEFEAVGVKHRIANYSVVPLNYNKEELLEDYKKVVTAAHSVFGGKHPSEEYLFIVQHLTAGGGGLEHLNSTTCQTSQQTYTNPFAYRSFLGLLAHEYFHVWNIKRLRPEALGPFDYENENYTTMLWVSEGFTSYYSNDILRRAGLIDEDAMLRTLAGQIGSVENQYGNKVQSVAEASWDAWIKYYRPNENSPNSTVSYYTKGGILANVLNMIIIGNTNGEQSLDNVLQNLYNEFYLKQDIGFTDKQFMDECSKVAGEDLTTFFENHIYGTETIDYKKYFDLVDVDAELVLTNPDKPAFGARVSNGRVVQVNHGTSAYKGGLNVNDDILEVNGRAFTSVPALMASRQIGENVHLRVRRGGAELDLTIPLTQDPTIKVNLKPRNSTDANAVKKYKKWMHLD